jgi:hypothetical protein
MSPLRALGLVACAVLALWCRLPALGDDISGAINGHVYGADPDEGDVKPLKAAYVYVYLPDNIEGRFVFPPIASRLTNQNGFYSFLGLLPGRYVIVARAKGWYGACWPHTSLVTGEQRRIDVYLWDRRVLARCGSRAWGDEGVSF